MLFTINSFFTAILGFLGIGSLSLKEYKKQFDAINYGIKVDVDGLDMNVVIQGDQNDQTIVLLPGMGMIAPYIAYKSLTEPLSENYKVITVEPFGYGLSDVTKKERTAENVVSELHICLQKLGVNKFYIMGHSLGGLFSYAYANKYPDEVLGYIGLDNTPINIEENVSDMTLEENIKNSLGKIIAKYHLYRFANEDQLNVFVEAALDPNYKYTEEDMKNLNIIYHYNSSSENVINEYELMKNNIASLKGVTIKCPILMFISTQMMDINSYWKPAHEDMAAINENSTLFELDGSHQIYIQQKEKVIDKIKKFIK